jgi:succinate dehydrogenase / fumarate reductase membrane anchor subunit
MGEGTALGRVRGLGSAHHGSHHWLLQRYTAAGNLLTVLFLAVSFVALPDLSYATVHAWLGRPLPALAIALLVVSVFWHARLGLQVLLEDYVHGATRFAAILLLNLAVFAGAGAGLLFVVQTVTAVAGEKTARDAMADAMSSAMSQGGVR